MDNLTIRLDAQGGTLTSAPPPAAGAEARTHTSSRASITLISSAPDDGRRLRQRRADGSRSESHCPSPGSSARDPRAVLPLRRSAKSCEHGPGPVYVSPSSRACPAQARDDPRSVPLALPEHGCRSSDNAPAAAFWPTCRLHPRPCSAHDDVHGWALLVRVVVRHELRLCAHARRARDGLRARRSRAARAVRVRTRLCTRASRPGSRTLALR